MEELLECMACAAKALVDDPDAVKVSLSEGDKESVVSLSVGPEDLGKVIGKSGRTAEALRTILSAASKQAGARCRLELVY